VDWKTVNERLIRRGELILDTESLENHGKELQERYTPAFTAEPRPPYTPDNLVYLFEEHPFVQSASVVTRFSSIERRQRKQVVEVKVDTASDLDEVLGYAERLREVREVYDTGLIPVQWHLIGRDLPPSSLCEYTESRGMVKQIRRLDDGALVVYLEIVLFEHPLIACLNRFYR